MKTFSNEQLKKIVDSSTPPCVSLFLSTHKQGRDTRQDPVELKNLLRTAEEKLTASGMRGTEARDMLDPATALLEDHEFWQNNDQGLAVFIAKDFFETYRVPIPLEESCHVNSRFDIKPLLPLMAGKNFYILAVSDNQARLLSCTPHTCSLMRWPADTATTLDEAIQGERRHETGVAHRGRNNAANPQAGGGSMHGEGAGFQSEMMEDRMFFYRQLDDAVRHLTGDEKSPLILAGADSVVPFFRRASKHKNILEAHIHGNAEHVSNEDLHREAIQLLGPVWHNELHDLQEQYGTAAAHELASSDLREILPAASLGRVGILFVTVGSTHWGKVGEGNEVTDADPNQHDAEDLIDRAAVETLRTQGQVVVVEPEEMPGDGELAAIYRY